MVIKSNRVFANELESRTLEFAKKVIYLISELPRNIQSDIIRRQLSRSGTSIGANYHEANRARSAADFKNKIKICEGEANETLYWLKLVQELKWISNENLQGLIKESDELVAIETV